jgi:MFS transporter, FHS family, glucose/mannose:H+ symporter
MNAEPIAANPSLRFRLPLYPSQFLIATAMVSIGPLLDPMMKEFGVPLSRGGLISAGLYVGNVSAIVILNTLLAKWPARWTLFGGTVVQGVALICAGALSRDLWSLIAAYLFVGFGGALMNTTCWIWITTHMVNNRAASALRMILFFALGMMTVPLIIGLVLDGGASWRWVLVTEGVLALLSAAAVVLLPLPDVCDRRNVRLTHVREVVACNPGLLLGMVVAGFAYVGAEMSMNVWLPKFQIDVFGAADSWASFSVTLFWVGLTAGRLIVTALTRRFSPSRLLLVCSCVFAVLAVAVALAPTQVTSLILAVGAGLGASASYGLVGSYAGRFPGWQSAVASSLFILAGGVGSITVPYLVGPLASAAGFRVALGIVAIPAVVYGMASLLIHARSGEGNKAAEAGRGGG